MAVRQRVLGQEHTSSLTAANDLARALTERGLREYRALVEESWGTSQWTRDTARRKLSEAVPIYRETLAIQQRVLGLEHPNTISTAVNLGNVFLAQDKPAEAELIFRELLGRELRNERPSALALGRLTAVAREFSRLLMHSDAERVFCEVLAIQQRALGPDHPDTLKTAQAVSSSVNHRRAVCVCPPPFVHCDVVVNCAGRPTCFFEAQIVHTCCLQRTPRAIRCMRRACHPSWCDLFTSPRHAHNRLFFYTVCKRTQHCAGTPSSFSLF
jgi:hypothetical protein